MNLDDLYQMTQEEAEEWYQEPLTTTKPTPWPNLEDQQSLRIAMIATAKAMHKKAEANDDEELHMVDGQLATWAEHDERLNNDPSVNGEWEHEKDAILDHPRWGDACEHRDRVLLCEICTPPMMTEEEAEEWYQEQKAAAIKENAEYEEMQADEAAKPWDLMEGFHLETKKETAARLDTLAMGSLTKEKLAMMLHSLMGSEAAHDDAEYFGLPYDLLPEFYTLQNGPWPLDFKDWIHHLYELGGTPHVCFDDYTAAWIKIKHGIIDEGVEELQIWIAGVESLLEAEVEAEKQTPTFEEWLSELKKNWDAHAPTSKRLGSNYQHVRERITETHLPPPKDISGTSH